MQKWGKHRNGTPRYRCIHCKTSQTWKRPDLTIKNRQDLYQTWLTSKYTLEEFAAKYHITRRTLYNWFTPFRKLDIPALSVDVSNHVFIIDGYYLEYAATVLVAQTPQNLVVGWSFTYAENFSTWWEFFDSIAAFPKAVVCDGQKGMVKAVKLRWPGVIIQRCQFHVIHHVNLLLTKHPETLAARQLKTIVHQIIQVKTDSDLELWLLTFKEWYQHYRFFLTQKTYADTHTDTGRKKWHYTHGHLHAAFYHVKRSLPYLFQYLKYPGIPNTTNRIEGGVNAQIQRLIDRHRGAKLFQRRQMIGALLKQKQLQKPTQIFT